MARAALLHALCLLDWLARAAVETQLGVTPRSTALRACYSRMNCIKRLPIRAAASVDANNVAALHGFSEPRNESSEACCGSSMQAAVPWTNLRGHPSSGQKSLSSILDQALPVALTPGHPATLVPACLFHLLIPLGWMYPQSSGTTPTCLVRGGDAQRGSVTARVAFGRQCRNSVVNKLPLVAVK